MLCVRPDAAHSTHSPARGGLDPQLWGAEVSYRAELPALFVFSFAVVGFIVVCLSL